MAKDHWTSTAYQSSASFVPQLTSKVTSYLDPQASERILDLGCGDGVLTSQIAQTVTPSGQVLGLDASKSFILTAQEKYSDLTNCEFRYQDCTRLEDCDDVVGGGAGSWDKVFSNAAMHWILRDPSIRERFFGNVYRALQKGGKFVFEMGGAGNVAEVHAAATAALTHVGVPLQKAREASPWFFPSTTLMSNLLEQAGFEVEVCELEYRPTKLTAETADKSGGLEGWVRLMCAQFLEVVEEGDRRNAVVKEICDILDGVLTREEDGSKWMGYVRLRAVARKK